MIRKIEKGGPGGEAAEEEEITGKPPLKTEKDVVYPTANGLRHANVFETCEAKSSFNS